MTTSKSKPIPPLSPTQRAKFPNLTDANHAVIENHPVTNDLYNCFAYVVGDKTTAWWPLEVLTEDFYWPSGYKREETVQAATDVLVKMFHYAICEHAHHCDGVEKIAIYANGEVLEHVAQQPHNQGGKWFSKLGRDELIRHDDLGVIESPGNYGVAVRYLSRNYSSKRPRLLRRIDLR